MEFGVVPCDAPHIAGRGDLCGDLPVLDVEGNLVGDDLPPKVMVQRDGVGVEQGEALALLVHLGQSLDHQPLHDAVAGVLWVGTHAGHKAYVIYRVVDVHFQRVDRELRDEVFAVKAAQHIGAFQHRKLGLLDLVVLPAGGGKLFLGHLKGIAQQGVILIEIVGLKITVCIILGRVHDRLPLCFQRRLPNSSIIHPLSKRRQEPFSQKTGQRIRRNAAFAGKSRTALLLDCTRFLSVVYCFCYGKVPVRCAGHSKEEKETNDENWI